MSPDVVAGRAVQHLLGIRHYLAAAGRHVARYYPEAELSPTLAEIEDHVVAVARELRQMTGALRDTGPYGRDLATTLRHLVAQLLQGVAGRVPEVALDIDPDAQVPDEIRRLLLRVAQEALRNALRHSGGRSIALRLHILAGSAELTVRDDGQGATLPGELRGLADTGHFGLIGLEEEVTLAGGRFALITHPGEGMMVTTSIPLHERTTGDNRDPHAHREISG